MVKQDISRFDIAVDHATLMGIINSATDACKEVNNFAGGWKISHARCAADVLGQCLSLDIIHDHVDSSVARVGRRGLEVVDLYDVRMV